MAHTRKERGLAGWVRRWWRALVAELVSTALLVGLGCASLVPLGGPGSVALTYPALAFGFLVVGNLCAFEATSGAHMNPAVTLSVALLGLLPPLPALAYVIAQCIGAIIGFGGLVAAMPRDVMLFPVGATVPAPTISLLAAVIIEAMLTGTLVLAACGLTGSPDTTAPIKLGLVVAGLIYAGGPATGASLNPARSLGPAVVYGDYACLWVYCVGPLAGAACAAMLYRWVLAPPSPPPTDAAVELDAATEPLKDRP